MTTLNEKIAQLEARISQLQSPNAPGAVDVKASVKCLPWRIILGIASPLLIFLSLYFIQPRFVQKKEGTRTVRSTTKVFVWTIFLSAIVLGGIYAWGKYKIGGGAVCSIK